jgi:type IV pilus assembly protein PilA
MKDLLTRVRARSSAQEIEGIEGMEAAEAGFTLIELMVVLLIIAILLAIAIPTFLGVSNSASDRASQSNLSNALTEGKALFEVNDAYASGTVAYTSSQFASQAPEFVWQTTACTATSSGNCVSYGVFDVNASGDSLGLALAVTSVKTNTCWYAWDIEATPSGSTLIKAGPYPTAGVWYAKSTSIPTNGCVALDPDTADTNLTGFVAGGAGTNYSNAPTVS